MSRSARAAAIRRWELRPGWCINETCLSRGAKRLAPSRGLCHCCYMELTNRIKTQEDPEIKCWEDAEERGYCLPKGVGRKRRFPIPSSKTA